MSAPESDPESPLPSSDPYVSLRCIQDRIGWDHFLRGKLAYEWSEIQTRYAKRYSLTKPSRNWQIWLIKYMATQSQSLWLDRNRSRHGVDGPMAYASQLAQAQRDVTALYELQDKVLPQDRELFCASLELHLLQSLSHLRGWLSVNKELIVLSVRTAASNSRAHTPRITRYFPKFVRPRPAKHRKKQSKPPRTYHPSRLTKFFTSTAKTCSTIRQAVNPPPPPSSFSRPRQRYLFDFFPNHPG